MPCLRSASSLLLTYALTDLLGGLAILGVRWPVILAIAFCCIDIVPLFAKQDEKAWYLFGAWILAAALNATLTWWGFSVAMAEHSAAGNIMPVIAAVMTWATRVLIFGTLSLEAANHRIAHIAEAYHERTLSRRRF